MKARRWYIKFPRDAYALGPVEFKTAVGERQVRALARDFEKVPRLPQGTAVWPAT